MSPHRLKARGGAGSKISLPPTSISPPLTCKILQERRALRKLLAPPPHLADYPLKPSLLPARRVPINTKEVTQHKKVPPAARLATAPSHKQAPVHPFKKPFYVGHGLSTSSMQCSGNGSASVAFRGAARVKRNLNVNVGLKHTGKSDAPQARLSRALACRALRNKTVEKHLTSMRAVKGAEHEKKNAPAQQNCDPTETCGGFILSNDSCLQHWYNVELNEDADCNINLKEEAPVWLCEQDLPSIFDAHYDRDPALPLSSLYKIGIRECVSPHNLGTRRSGHGDGLDTCRLVPHSNADHQEFDRSRDAWKMSGSPNGPAIVDCSSGSFSGCKNASQTQASNQDYSNHDQKVDLSDKPRMLRNDVNDVFNDICTPRSIGSSQEFCLADSRKNVREKLRASDEIIFDYTCKFKEHRYARIEDCGDSQVNAILQEFDDSRSRGISSSKPSRSYPIKHAAFESPWRDVDACEFAIHESFADYQEIDEIDSSGNLWVAEHDQSSLHKILSIQMNSSSIDNAKEKGKHIHSLQEKLALLEDSVSSMAANLKKTSGQLDAKIDDNGLLLCCIQNKLSSIEGLVTRMEAFNCEDLRD